MLQEYFVTVTRKLGVDPRIARRKVERLAEFDVVAPEVPDILAAIDLHRFTDFPSGTLGFCGQPNRLDAGYFSQKICKKPGRSMGSEF